MLRAHEGAPVEKPDPRVIDCISGAALHRHVTDLGGQKSGPNRLLRTYLTRPEPRHVFLSPDAR
jgi:hypothetical protein